MTRSIADKQFDPAIFEGASCAFGVFDGLHKGHRFLIDQAIATADQGKSLVLTFDIDPDEVFHPQRLHKLMTNEERLCALEESGVQSVVVLPFIPSLYTLAAPDFLASTFGGHAPAHLHVGDDFRFGAKAAGTVDDLIAWGDVVGTTIHSHELVSTDGIPITATRIRELLESGNQSEARKLLGHDL